MSIFKSLFGTKQKEEDYPKLTDLSVFHTDIHSHLIPGIDDGVQSMTESIEMIQGMIDLGIKRIITTPHIMSDYFKNTPEIILDGLEQVRAAVKQEEIDIKIDAAAEYYLDENFINKVRNEKMLTINNKYLLFEISYITTKIHNKSN